MTCSPITEEQKKVWIEYLEQLVKILDGQPEIKVSNSIFGTYEGDVNTGKLIAGHLLATLKKDVVTIK